MAFYTVLYISPPQRAHSTSPSPGRCALSPSFSASTSSIRVHLTILHISIHIHVWILQRIRSTTLIFFVSSGFSLDRQDNLGEVVY